MRDQQRLQHGPLLEYPTKEFGDTVPRAGNASGGGQPGAALRCAPGGPNDYVYVIIQPPSWAPLMRVIGREELIEDLDYATPEARLPRIPECFSIIEKWTITKSKFEVMDALNEFDIPCGPILSMKDIYEDKELFERGMLVEIDHPERGRYVQVGMPIKLSDSPAEVKRSPLLGEHTDEVLGWLGYDSAGIKTLHDDGAV
jgi:formyl-CoA transferase